MCPPVYVARAEDTMGSNQINRLRVYIVRCVSMVRCAYVLRSRILIEAKCAKSKHGHCAFCQLLPLPPEQCVRVYMCVCVHNDTLRDMGMSDGGVA